jgi:hypothetical protein
MDAFLAIATGVALAAACGFRVFVPLLIASVAVHFGYLTPSASLNWVGSTPAMIVFITATIAEIAGYYIPWIDNLLDAVASPVTVVAGTLAAATAFGDIDPVFKWALALIAGGGVAASIQGATVASRAVSTGITGGFGNFIIATLEAAGAAILALLAIILPILAFIAALVLLLILIRFIFRRRAQRRHLPWQTPRTAD